MVDKIVKAAGTSQDAARIAVLGVTFKADTDDVRESPALAIVQELIKRGSPVTVYDPQGMERAAGVLGDAVGFVEDEYRAADGCDVAVIATEWKQFGALSLAQLRDVMAQPVLVDLRNLWDPEEVAAAGFRYLSVGRPE